MAKQCVTDLCRHLQLSRRSFYRYFDDLDDVLNSLLDHTFQNLVIAPQEPNVYSCALRRSQKEIALWQNL